MRDVGFSKLVAATLLLPLGLAGCASLSGNQASIISPADGARLVAKFPVDVALAEFGSLTDSTRRMDYRNLVVGAYMTAIVANYVQFRWRVRDERTELSLGADIVALAFTSYATVAGRSIVNELSAAAGAFGAFRGTLDRDVYFNRSLPGLIASMDAEHLRRRAAILENLRRPADEYPLAVAFSDLSDLELAGSLDRAIEDMTARAAQERQAAQETVRTAVRSCQADADATPVARRLSVYLRSLVNPTPPATAAEGAAKLRLIAIEMQLSPEVIASQDANSIRIAITARIGQGQNGRCAKADLESLLGRIQQRTGDTIAP